MANLRIALLLVVAIAATAGDAWSETTDEAGSAAQNGRPLDVEELQRFAASPAAFDLVDLVTGKKGRIVSGKEMIIVTWYFAVVSDRAYLTRDGVSCIVVRDAQLTKCLTVSEDRHSGACRYIVQERRDKRAACLREAAAP
jgi:hypothetical protein